MTPSEAADLRAAALVASLNAPPLSQRRAILERPIPEYHPSDARAWFTPDGLCPPAGASFMLSVEITNLRVERGCAKDVTWDGTCVVVGGPNHGLRYRPKDS